MLHKISFRRKLECLETDEGQSQAHICCMFLGIYPAPAIPSMFGTTSTTTTGSFTPPQLRLRKELYFIFQAVLGSFARIELRKSCSPVSSLGKSFWILVLELALH